MYEMTVKGVIYENVVYSDKGYIVQETGTRFSGKYNNKYRVLNTHGEDKNHTHLNSFDVCKAVIHLVQHGKLPRTAKKYIIRSCIRLSTDDEYKGKVECLLKTKLNKGKQAYHDKRVGLNGHCNRLHT